MTDATLASALAQLQTNLPKIPKASKAQYGNYANLTDVTEKLLPELGKLGLSFSAKPTWVQRDDGTREFVLAYTLRHVSGEHDDGEYPLGSNPTNHQNLGSAITYGRRYCLCAITGAVAEDDDDGAAASAPPKAARGEAPERAAGNLPTNSKGQVARSQVTDAELAASGNMTDAEQREHNRLEREVKGIDSKGKLVDGTEVERLAATPDDDPWAQVTPLRAPQAAPPKAGQIHQYFNRLLDIKPGHETTEQRLERLGFLGAIIGHPVKSTNDLTAVEGVEAARFLGGCKNRDALVEKLALRAGESVDA